MKLASALFIEFRKKNCPIRKQKAIKIIPRNSIKLGILKTTGKKTDAITDAIKLFNNKILKIFSLWLKYFMQIISKPIIMAPIMHNNAIGLNDRSNEGLIRQSPPKSETIAPSHLTKSIFSFKIYIAKNIAKIGFKKFIAVASLAGIYKSEVNQIEIPIIPRHDRKPWILINFVFKLVLNIKDRKSKKINEKKNLAWTIWKGLMLSKNKELPNTLVAILPHAKENDAAIMKITESKIWFLFERWFVIII